MEAARYNIIEIDQIWFFKQILIYTSMWIGLYITIHYLLPVKHSKKKQTQLHDKLVSLVHGTLTFCFSMYFSYYKNFDFEVTIDFFSAHLISFSLGYFIYDTLQCSVMGLMDSKLAFHHSMCVILFSYIAYDQKGIFLGVIGLGMAESSAFPMNIRGICRLFNMHHTKFLELFEILYFGTYILFRGVISPFLIWAASYSPTTPVFVQLVVIAIFVQSIFFMKTMVSILMKKYREYAERKSKNVGLYWLSKNPKVDTLDYVMKKSKSANLF